MVLIESYNDNGVWVITLNDSDNGNRLNWNSLNALSKEINRAILNDEARVIVLRSNGKHFCLGMDLNFLQEKNEDKDVGEQSISLYVDLLLKIYEAPKPVIALVNGDVKAGGMGLIGACDIVVASEESTFELSEVLLGLIPANVLPFVHLVRLQPKTARYLIMTAKRMNAAEAKGYGLVDEVFPLDKLEKGTKAILKTLFRAAPHAIAETKHFTQSILGKNLDEATNLAKEALMNLIGKKEVIEGITAFNEGDVPPWFGKMKLEKPLIIEEKK